MRYVIKCGDCKVTIGETDSLGESAAGGRCARCVREWDAVYERGRKNPGVPVCVMCGREAVPTTVYCRPHILSEAPDDIEELEAAEAILAREEAS